MTTLRNTHDQKLGGGGGGGNKIPFLLTQKEWEL